MVTGEHLPWPGRDDAIRHAQRFFGAPGDVIELRALGVRKGQFSATVSGYFDSAEKLVDAAAELDGHAEGIYLTLNPVRADLLARANNRLVTGPKHATADTDVRVRRLLLVDLDPRRPSGISATDEERRVARSRADEIASFLMSVGFTDPIQGDSGNGFHLIYRVDLPVGDNELVKRVLEALAFRFDDDRVQVDQTVHNAARITKLFGTLARKGDSTAERPHRRSRLLSVPHVLEPVPVERLQALAAQAPSISVMRSATRPSGHFDVDGFLSERGLVVARHGEWHGGKRWVLAECPFNPDHRDRAAFVVQFSNGAIAAGCHHNGCQGKGWTHLRGPSAQPATSSLAPRPAKRVRKALNYQPFPTGALPEPLRSYVRGSASAIGCDDAYVALPLLAGVGSAIGNTRRLRLKRGWYEPPILWTANVGDSGSQKTPAFKAATAPIQELQKQALKKHAQELEEFEPVRLAYEKELAKWKRLKTEDPPPQEPPEPIAERYFCADTTIEALAPLLVNRWRGLLMLRDELSGWIGGFNQYKQGHGGDTAQWLEMHYGQPLMVDRKTGFPRTLYVPAAAVSVTGGIQPRTLKRCLGDEHFENGLAARLLMAYPPRRPRVWSEAQVPGELETAIEVCFARLYALEPEYDEGGEPRWIAVELTADAKRAWIAFYNEHGQEQVDLAGDVAAAWSKLEGYAARFALIFHLVRLVNGEAGECVDEQDVTGGAVLARWFGNEAKRIYAILPETEDEEELRHRVEVLQRKGGSVTAREWQRARSLETSDEAQRQLDELADAGLGRWEHVPPGAKGGQPTRRFVLNADATAAASSASEVVSVSDVSGDVGAQGGVEASPETKAAPSPDQPGVADPPTSPKPSDATDTDTTGLAPPSDGVASDEDQEWGEV